MARYDVGATYDSGYIYDATLGVLTAEEAVVAGESAALPDRRIPWRDAAATICGFDPFTWLPTDQLEHVAIDATRSGTLNTTGRQEETLTFRVAQPFTVGLAEGDWLCVRWSVTVATDTTTFLGGVFRITDAPGIDADDAGVLFRVQAVDWWSYIALTEFSDLQFPGSGWVDALTLIHFAEAYYLAGGVIIGDASPPSAFEEPTWLAALLWHYGTSGTVEAITAPFHVTPWTDFGLNFAVVAQGRFIQITSAGVPLRVAELVAWFWLGTGGYTLAYHPDGGLWLQGKTPIDSGLYLTTDTRIVGSVPLPVETAQHTVSRPQFVTVEYRLFSNLGANILFATESGAGAGHDLNVASVERINDTGGLPISLGAFGPADYVHWRLQGHLGAADTLTLTVDSAFPPPPLGRLIAIRIIGQPAGDNLVTGWYRLLSFTQPLHTGPATWQLQWWSAFSG